MQRFLAARVSKRDPDNDPTPRVFGMLRLVKPYDVTLGAGFAGSRSGALIATAWAAMLHQGEQGYLRLTDGMMQASAPNTVPPPISCLQAGLRLHKNAVGLAFKQYLQENDPLRCQADPEEGFVPTKKMPDGWAEAWVLN